MTQKSPEEKPAPGSPHPAPDSAATPPPEAETGGRDGPEPTRYGDWEVGGICTDF